MAALVARTLYNMATEKGAKTMPGQPILPSNMESPTGQDSRERKFMRDIDRRVAAIGKEVLRILKEQNYTVVTLNAMQANATSYQFELDQAILLGINSEIERISELILLEGGEQELWSMRAYVEPAYVQGTAVQMANLTVQSELYALTKPSLDAILFSEPYRKRIGLLRAREFELMKGFTAQTKTDLAGALTRGMIAGLNPRVIAKDIAATTGVNQRRGERIARTEVGNAFRQARMDEAEAARIDLGIRTLELHLSALSPTTRPNHRARHATLHSVADQRAWWAISGQSVNCKCSTVSVLVDEKGNPLSPAIVERAKRKLK